MFRRTIQLLREAVWQHGHLDFMKGGRADRRNPKSFNQRELKMGIKHEMEHTKDRRQAMEIAMDHLAENPKYYSTLKRYHID